VLNADVPTDRVATQRPQPGEQAKEGSTVTITVSSGPGEATIPGVVGLKRAEAERRIKDAGFKTDARKENSDSVKEGRVISTSPPENSQLEKGRTVVLVVSSGPEQVEVPNVTGQSEDAARSALEGAGLSADVSEEETADQDPGIVLRQDPGGGARVDKGSSVSIVVAKAPPDVAVPDVLDQDEQSARGALTDAGFRVRVRRQDVDNEAQDGVVVDQNPAAGEERPQDTRVTIVVGRFTPPPEETVTPEPTATVTPEVP
jgi:beta-lactam-binding protein with PASTA domain